MIGIFFKKKIANSYVVMAYGEGGGGLKASPFGLLPLYFLDKYGLGIIYLCWVALADVNLLC